MKHHELLWGSAIVAFIAWVLLAPNASMRIDRVCRPLHWASSGVVSLTALTAPKYEADAQNGGNRVVYGCEYSIWRLFYQKDYDAYLAAQRRRLLGPHLSRLQRCAAAAVAAAKGGAHSGTGAESPSCAKPQPIVSHPASGRGS
ncbi:MAG: hypothetical protein ACYCV6_02765 [Steroidobacteraceae bacterium]